LTFNAKFFSGIDI